MFEHMYEDFDWSEIAFFSGDFADFAHLEDVINSLLCVICVLSAGLAAGLTMGLLSLDVTKLEIKVMTGSAEEKADAEAILPIVKKHHLLLVTLLLFNSLANEALPVFLSTLVPEWLSVLISVTLVLIFGEILPSAFFTGKAQLHTAATMVPFVKGLTILLWPVGYPLSQFLDYAFGCGEESSLITREELGALFFLQNSETVKTPKDLLKGCGIKDRMQKIPSLESLGADGSEEDEGGLSMYEINIMTGILKLSKLKVKDSMIKIKSVFMISDSTRLDQETLQLLWNSGFSRIPVFKRRDKQHIIGYLLIKSLILVNPDDKMPVETLPIRQPFFVKPNLGLLEMLSIFREGRCHLALVTEDPISALQNMKEGKRPTTDRANVIGIVTLEDVIEEILQGEIIDETDVTPCTPVGSMGGTSAMGIFSMGRNSLMHKTDSSKSITKGPDRYTNLVKKTIRYPNICPLLHPNSISPQSNSPLPNSISPRHNSISPRPKKRSNSISLSNISESRKNWHQRFSSSNIEDPKTRFFSDRTRKPRKEYEYEGIGLRTQKESDHTYGAINKNDDYLVGNESIDRDSERERESHIQRENDESLEVMNLDSRSRTNGMYVSTNYTQTSSSSALQADGDGKKEEIDSWMSGDTGYRIIKNASLVSFDDILVEE